MYTQLRGLESLEKRMLLATVTHTAVVSENPADITPHIVLNGAQKTYAFEQIGGTMYAGGKFDLVQDPTKTITYARQNFMAFDAETGVISPLDLSFNGSVLAIEASADETALFISGTFSHVNEIERRGIMKYDLVNNQIDPNFAPTNMRTVSDIKLVNGALIAAGNFDKHLMAMDPTNGADLGTIDITVEGVVYTGDETRIGKIAVSPDGTTLVATGNFATVDGQGRKRAFMLDLGTTATLSTWHAPRFDVDCDRNSTLDSAQGVDFSPDGSYFVIVANGGSGMDGICDAAARFETADVSSTVEPTWINWTGGDTLWSVAITDAAVYVGGHNRWLDNPDYDDEAGPNAVERPGIGAIDPVTGLALPWNPTKSRNEGTRALFATPDGLWVGSDGERFGNEDHYGIGFVPLDLSPTPDTIRPNTFIDSGPSALVSGTSATFNFSADESSVFQCRLDGAAFTPCTSPTTYENLTAGSHILQVVAIDDSYNMDASPAEQSWFVVAPGTELIGNPGFEVDTSGWKGFQASNTLTQVAGGHSGGWAVEVTNTVAGSFGLDDSPSWVSYTDDGSYTASIWARSDSPGLTLKLRVREYLDGSLQGTVSETLALTSSWQLLTANVTPVAPGSSLDFEAYTTGAPAGVSFQLDDASITLDLPGNAPEVIITESGGSTDVTEGGPPDSYDIVLSAPPTADVTVTVSPDGQVTAAGVTTVLAADFNLDEDGFGYVDDSFRGTAEPLYASGVRLPSGGFSGGGLQVTVGGIDEADIFGMSGGWQQSFTLNDPTDVTFSFKYNLTQAPNYKSNEFSQALVSVDGVLFGNGPNDYIAQFVGDGDGGNPQSTGWQTFELNTGTLSAGTHTIAIGAYNNQKTSIDESTELLIDDVLGVIDPSSVLTFTPSNWSFAQTVTVAAVDDPFLEGWHFSTITHSASSADPIYDGIPTNSVITNITDNEAGIGAISFLSFAASATLPGGLSVENEDVVAFDGSAFSMFLDGSDVGISGTNVDALAVISGNEILLSFSSPEIIPGISGTVEDSDIVKFTATELGDTTSGTFEMFMRGSDVGLSPLTEDIDAIDLHDDGRLIVSTVANVDVTGVSGADDDLLAFTPDVPGDYSSGTWAMYFDGSDVELASEDVNAFGLDSSGNIYLSTTNAFAVTGVSGDDEDVFTFVPTQIGDDTTGTYSSTLMFDGSLFGLDANDINGIDIPKTQGVTIAESGGTTDVTEGGAADSYTVVLDSVPTTDVDVTVTPDSQTDLGSGAGTPIVLTFTPITALTPQSVTVTAVDDTLIEGPHTSTITHTAVSGDSGYNGRPISNLVANITDNDVFGVTISQSGGSTDVTEGGTVDSYTVVLDSLPTANVDVTVTPDSQTDLGAVAGTAIVLTFTPANAYTAQTVNVTPIDDAVAEGLHTSTITHTAASADTNYNGLAIDNVVANITDNDTAGVTITESGTTDVTEGGATDSYDVVLTSQPATGTTVTVTIATTDGQVSTTPTSLVFDDTNWNVAQSVTVTAVDDAIAEGLHTGSITHSATSADTNYNGISIGSVTANITDNETAGVTITESGTTDVTEGGATDSYDVVLDSQPATGTTVTIAIATADGQAATTPTNLVFDETNWNVPQSVTVTAVDDAIAEGLHTGSITHTSTSADSNYNGIGIASVTANIIDNDIAGVTITESGGTTDVTEGGATDNYDVALSSQPATGTTVTITINTTDGQTTTAPTSLVFDDTNWNVAQSVIVTAVDDAAQEGSPHIGSITHAATSADTNYNGISIANVTANITDNDTAGVTITESGGTTDVAEDGANDSYDVVLNSQPATGTTVTITINTADGQTTTAPTSLVFDDTNWNVAQSVNVTAVDDAVQEGSPHIGSITHTVTSADTNYNGISIASVTANITDNDIAGVTITETGGTTDVTEGGATDNYDVVLDSQPAAGTTVTITINTVDGQTTTAPTSLVFDDTNWNVAQSVIVTAVDDVTAEGIHTGSITHTVTSTDSNYDGVGTANVTTNITDNDAAGVTITESGGTTDVSEGGPTDSYDVVLNSQPASGTTVTITISTANSQTTTIPTSLVFDETNWNVAKPVTVTAFDDAVAEGLHTGSITHTVASTDPIYDGIGVAGVTANITDNDIAGVTITESGTTDVSEGGATDSYEVVLTSQPEAGKSVTITIGTADGQTTISPTSLVYDYTNWNIAQSVTVTAVDDAVAEGLHIASITHTATSTAENYDGIGIAAVTANITDNEIAGVTITESGTTDISEGGATDSYDVVLDSQPVTGTTVTITIATADGQTATTPTSLLFDETNWNLAQSVTVSAVDDATQEGSPHTGSITHTATSTDASYDSIGIASVTANIIDNDTAGVTITESGGATDVTEGGATDSYDVVLDSQPLAGTTVTITIGTPDGQTMTSPTSLVFDEANWSVAQIVTVTAFDDAAAEGLHSGSIMHTVTSTDSNYDGIGVASVTANITDNETAGVTISESGTTDVTEGGATDSYDVVLDSQPETGTTVTITIATTDGQTSVTPISLEFTEADWNSPQSVTVTAVDDSIAEGLHTGILTHTVTSADTNYNGIGIASVTANISDNDVAGVTITQSGTTDLAEGGVTDGYDVVLDSQPESGATVTIAINTADGQSATAPTSLVFDETNWNIAQSVTVTAIDDAVAEGLHSGSITHTATSTDSNYNGIGIASVTANITDNETAGVTINSPVAVTEGDNTVGDTYNVVLTSEPVADVTISFNGGGQLSNAPDLIFTALNWNTPQDVTIFAIDDSVAEGAHIGTVAHSAASADGNYNGISIDDVTATITDNDFSGVTITESGGSTAISEGGPSDSYDVVLDSQPAAGTTVTIMTATTDGQTATTPTSLVFDESNWSVPQSVTVSAVDDAAQEGSPHTGIITHTATSADPNYDGISITSVTASITDNDSAGVMIIESGGTTEVTEGGATDSYDVVLSTQPAPGTTVAITISSPDGQTVASPTTLEFDETSWNVPQSVTVTAVDDVVAEGLHSGSITHSVASTDANYDGIGVANVTANITDNETAGVTITESGSTDVTEGGVSDSYDVVLDSQPQTGTTVTITIATTDGQTAVTPTSLVFDETNWNVPQIVTVTAVDDAIAEGLHSGSITHSANSTDTNYDGIAIASVTANITDNDTAGVTVSESGTTDVSESGTADSYDVVLDSQPAAGTSVTITINTADGQSATTPTSLVFVDTNWNVAQSVTVTAVDDDVAEGLHSGLVTHSVASTDSHYDGMGVANVTANITDNDTAGVTITESGTTDLTEGGVTDSYDVVLDSQPTAGTTVTIAIGTTDGQTAVTPTSLVFDDTNWNVAQSVTVTAVDDSVAESSPHAGSITHTATSTDANYNGIGITSVTANITDNDIAGVTIAESGTTDVAEGGATDSYDAVLDSQPAAGTSVTITINTADGQTTTSPISLVFDDTNWNVPQSMTVSAVDDAVAEGLHSGSITHAVASTDPNYDGIVVANVTANITDNEATGVTITESGSTDVTEGGATDSYDVVLDSQPELGTTVTITVATTDGQTVATATSLVFDDTNWSVPQSVTVTAVDDFVAEGSPHAGSITHTATSADTNYDGIGIASVTANITDNDIAGVTITESGTTDVSETGTADSYDVVLDSQPAAGTSVTITINTPDGQTATTPTSLLFDETNWSVAQSVTVTAVDDAVAEGLHSGSITHTVNSTDANYDGIGVASVTANITDNETAGVAITESGTTDVTEGGATDSYDVVLNSQPQTGTTVTIAIATADGQTTTTPTSLVFDDTNWNVAQSVTVTAIDDATAEGLHTSSISHTATSTDTNYDGIGIAGVTANITDNEIAGVTISESGTTDVAEGGAIDSYDVVLDSQPETGTTVTITVATADGQTTTSPTSLVFDDTNWNVAQSVTVTAVDDEVAEGLHTGSITHSVTSADSNYHGVAVANVTANITDNDFAGVTITESLDTTYVSEGGPTDSYDLVLDSRPETGTTVTITIGTADGQTTTTPTFLVFDDTNWGISQTVTVTAVDDGSQEGSPHTGSITHTSASTDPNYNNIAIASVIANITDNDFAGVTITESGGTTDVGEGGTTDSYDVVLDSQPETGTTVTITIDTADGQTSTSPTSLDFDDTNWNVAQTVTVTAVDDLSQEASPHTGGITHTVTSADSNYNGIGIAGVTANITDNDTPGVAITESNGSTDVTEGGATDTYDVVLESQPEAGKTVTITIATSDGQFTTTPTSLEFNDTNWNTAQTVTITAVDDAMQEPTPHIGSITHTVASTDSNYNGIGVASLTVNVNDNDTAGVTVSESGTTDVSEGGPTDSYDVVLNSQPESGKTVTITVATADGQSMTTPTNVVFNDSNWNVAQTVTVTAVDDAVIEGLHTSTLTHTAVSTDSNYDGIAISSVTANITDNDSAGVVITESGATDVSEGGATDSYDVILTSQPETGSTVTIAIATTDGQTTTTPTSLVFNDTNWNVAQTVTVAAVDDAIAEGLHSGSITHSVTSTDANYDGIGVASVTANITDDDVAGVTITESGTTDVTEGGATDSYDVVLTSQPESGKNVTITIATTEGQSTTTPVSLVFDETNWNVAQTVIVTAVDDDLDEGSPHTDTITHTASSTDTNYDAIAISSVTVNVTDDDVAGVTITESGTTDVSEGGATDSYDVVLDSQPETGTIVTITINTADGQTATTPTSLLFNDTNWNVAQSVTVTAVDDTAIEGLHISTLTHTAVSTDANYDAIGISSVTANITDNDAAGVTITASGTTDVSEGGTTDSYDVVLDGQPELGTSVTITINTADGQTTTTPTSLVFDDTNWNIAQTVTVTAVDDAIAEGPHVGSITHTVTSTDTNYDGIAIDGVTANITDNDAAGVTITESGTTDISEGGATDSYDVVLNSQPVTGTTVTITINTADGQTTTTPTSLVFDDTNWTVAQTVTVTAVDDAVVEGLHTGSITHTATSPDVTYEGIAINNVVASITDNDVSDDSFIYMSFKNTATLPGGLTVANEDIVKFDGTSFSLVFDGSDVGLATTNVDALAIIDTNEFLLSFRAPENIPGIAGQVQDSDIVKFTATQLGDTTVGTFELFFRGSDHGLSPITEDIDAIDLHPDGRLIVSTIGNFTVPGATGRDEDLIAFTPNTPGDYSAGTWAFYVDGSDVEIGREDVYGVSLNPNGNIHFSVTNDFAVTEVSGTDADVFTLIPTQLGATTVGSYDPTLLFDGSEAGLNALDVNGIDIPTTGGGGGGGGDALQLTSLRDVFESFVTDETETLDVNADGNVTALDALLVINSLSTLNSGSLDDGRIDEMDVNGDNMLSVLDALRVVNFMGRGSVLQAEIVDSAAPMIGQQIMQRELDDAGQDLPTTPSPTVGRQAGEQPINQSDPVALQSRAILELMAETQSDADDDEELLDDELLTLLI